MAGGFDRGPAAALRTGGRRVAPVLRRAATRSVEALGEVCDSWVFSALLSIVKFIR
jgi:hypothetical protein